MKIKITSALDNNLFGQYKGTYLDELVKIEEKGMYGGSIDLTVNTGNEITIDTTAIKDTLVVDTEIDVDGVWSIYAKNPKMGGVLLVTKVDEKYMMIDIINTMEFARNRLREAKDNGLLTEVVVWSLKSMKGNPGLTIEQAIKSGFEEWVK